MRIVDALANGREIVTADAEVLLADVLRCERTALLAHPERELSDDEARAWESMRERRKVGEPVAYIRGKQEFYGREFFVDRSVLIPRPATERLVEIALAVLQGKGCARTTEIDRGIVAYCDVWGDTTSVRHIADIGTGSGCIAVTIACERPDLNSIATDISHDALIVAKKNAEKFHVADRIVFKQGRGLQPLSDFDKPFLIVSNPPYIPEGTDVMKDVSSFEPHEALFAGEQGMDVIGSMMKEMKRNPMCIGMLVECERRQAKLLAEE